MEYLTVAQAAERTGASTRTIREHCEGGTFAGAFRAGASDRRAVWLIPAAAVARFKRRPVGNPNFSRRKRKPG